MHAYGLDTSRSGELQSDIKLARDYDSLGTIHTARQPRLPNDFLVGTNQFIDIRPPGVREQIPDPSRPYFGPYRSQLYEQRGTSNNAPPMMNWGDDAKPHFWESPWNQRIGNAWFEELERTRTTYHWLYQERGQFIVPYTGFSPLGSLRPASTLGDVL